MIMSGSTVHLAVVPLSRKKAGQNGLAQEKKTTRKREQTHTQNQHKEDEKHTPLQEREVAEATYV